MTVLVCFTFLLNALVEKATRTFDQRERIELGSPERCRTNLRDILETASSNSQAFVAVTSPFGPRAYMATLPMCTCLLYRGSVFMATRTTLLITCVKCQSFERSKSTCEELPAELCGLWPQCHRSTRSLAHLWWRDHCNFFTRFNMFEICLKGKPGKINVLSWVILTEGLQSHHLGWRK